ncbi:hypothetical protein OSB04_003560 [Centaurea solstitialis]|uniref:Uncharacterized protein n=1 Tax=Centaurea solstitialis TaxID=347529 RepID=A0AA38TWW3_9ASTR|nr:hypothetical protein OSB04_003560 [Centaurea solstitialis]
MDDFESNSNGSDLEKERKTLLSKMRRKRVPSTDVDIHVCNGLHCYLSQELTQTLLHDLDMPTRSVQIEIRKKYQMKFSRMKAFKVKQLALQKIHGDYSRQYAIVRDYLEELQRTNESTTIKLEVECNPIVDTRRFKRLYVCIRALKKGFKAKGCSWS